MQDMASVSTQHIEKLTENYESWKLHMRSILIYNDLWPYTNGIRIKTEENEQEWISKDEKALALIFLSVHQSQLNHVKKAKTSKEAWEKLKMVHESKGPVRKAALYKQLYKMKKDESESMTQYISTLQNKAEQLEDAGIKLPDELLSIMLLNSLPAEYENFCVAIESRDELPHPENLKIKLIEEEARRGENGVASSEATDKNDALITKRKTANKFVKQKEKEKYKQTKFNGTCHVCKKYGHRAAECRSKTERTQMKREDAMTAVALRSFQESGTWCLDSGATTHMCKDKDKFLSLDCERTQIYTATEESVKSAGKGQIKIKVSSNEIKLKEAMLVPDFKNNLLSVSSITNNGYKVIFEKERNRETPRWVDCIKSKTRKRVIYSERNFKSRGSYIR